MKIVNITTFKQFLTEVKVEALAQGWELVADITKTDTYRDLIFKNENGMYVSLSEGFSGSVVQNLIFANFFESYNPALESISLNVGAFPNRHNDTNTFRNVCPMLPLINNSMNIFMFINKYKMIFVAKVDQVYYYLYLGEANRLGTFEQYKKPWLATSNCYLSNNVSRQSFFEPGSSTVIKNINSLNINCDFRYPTFNDNLPDWQGKNILIPVLLSNSESYIQQVEDCFFMSSKTGIISENILTFDGIDYIVFRTSSDRNNTSDYIAIKK